MGPAPRQPTPRPHGSLKRRSRSPPAERVRANPTCPLVPLKRPHSSLQILAVARVTAALCAWIGVVWTVRSAAPDPSSPSDGDGQAARRGAGVVPPRPARRRQRRAVPRAAGGAPGLLRLRLRYRRSSTRCRAPTAASSSSATAWSTCDDELRALPRRTARTAPGCSCATGRAATSCRPWRPSWTCRRCTRTTTTSPTALERDARCAARWPTPASRCTPARTTSSSSAREVLTPAARRTACSRRTRHALAGQARRLSTSGAYPVARARRRARAGCRRRCAAACRALASIGFEPTNLARCSCPPAAPARAGAARRLPPPHRPLPHQPRLPGGEGAELPGVPPALRHGLDPPSWRATHGSARKRGSRGAAVWLSELIWRDFYHQVLHHHPHVVGHAFQRGLRRDRAGEHGKHADAWFAAWCEGRTGYPLVDAAMAQINQTGYMHNRLRMVTASFLVKDLGIDWRRGEAYFATHLNDFDLAANNGGWQWAASTGCDAQPYFRIFNPVTQSERFDADGKFIRRYLPQLAKLPNRLIHAPWLARPEDLQAAGVGLGRDYPRRSSITTRRAKDAGALRRGAGPALTPITDARAGDRGAGAPPRHDASSAPNETLGPIEPSPTDPALPVRRGTALPAAPDVAGPAPRQAPGVPRTFGVRARPLGQRAPASLGAYFKPACTRRRRSRPSRQPSAAPRSSNAPASGRGTVPGKCG